MVDQQIDLNRLINKKLDKNQPTAYIIWGENKPPLYHIGEVCHASLHSIGPGYDDMITSIGEPNPANIRYQKELLKSPFKHYAQFVVINEEHGYIEIGQLDKWPANVLYNYCIATRFPVEHLNYWTPCLEADGEDPLRVLLTTLKDKRFSWWGHCWFDGGYWDDNYTSVESTLNGEMANSRVSKKTFKQDPHACVPCNVIWKRK